MISSFKICPLSWNVCGVLVQLSLRAVVSGTSAHGCARLSEREESDRCAVGLPVTNTHLRVERGCSVAAASSGERGGLRRDGRGAGGVGAWKHPPPGGIAHKDRPLASPPAGSLLRRFLRLLPGPGAHRPRQDLLQCPVAVGGQACAQHQEQVPGRGGRGGAWGPDGSRGGGRSLHTPEPSRCPPRPCLL